MLNLLDCFDDFKYEEYKYAKNCCDSCYQSAIKCFEYNVYGKNAYIAGFKKAAELIMQDGSGDLDFVKHKLTSLLKEQK